MSELTERFKLFNTDITVASVKTIVTGIDDLRENFAQYVETTTEVALLMDWLFGDATKLSLAYVRDDTKHESLQLKEALDNFKEKLNSIDVPGLIV